MNSLLLIHSIDIVQLQRQKISAENYFLIRIYNNKNIRKKTCLYFHEFN